MEEQVETIDQLKKLISDLRYELISKNRKIKNLRELASGPRFGQYLVISPSGDDFNDIKYLNKLTNGIEETSVTLETRILSLIDSLVTKDPRPNFIEAIFELRGLINSGDQASVLGTMIEQIISKIGGIQSDIDGCLSSLSSNIGEIGDNTISANVSGIKDMIGGPGNILARINNVNKILGSNGSSNIATFLRSIVENTSNFIESYSASIEGAVISNIYKIDNIVYISLTLNESIYTYSYPFNGNVNSGSTMDFQNPDNESIIFKNLLDVTLTNSNDIAFYMKNFINYKITKDLNSIVTFLNNFIGGHGESSISRIARIITSIRGSNPILGTTISVSLTSLKNKIASDKNSIFEAVTYLSQIVLNTAGSDLATDISSLKIKIGGESNVLESNVDEIINKFKDGESSISDLVDTLKDDIGLQVDEKIQPVLNDIISTLKSGEDSTLRGSVDDISIKIGNITPNDYFPNLTLTGNDLNGRLDDFISLFNHDKEVYIPVRSSGSYTSLQDIVAAMQAAPVV